MNPVSKLDWAKNWISKKSSAMNYVDGVWITGTSAKSFDIINPADESLLCKYTMAGASDVEKAAFSAKSTAEKWGTTSSRKRYEILTQVAARIRENAEELATLETLCNGKTYKESLNDDLPESADVFEYYAGWTDKYYGELCPVNSGFTAYTKIEPAGVCGLIVPWNFPLLLACWKIAPALAMGNPIIVKPSEQTPLTLVRLFELISDLFPKNVIQLLVGDGPTTGQSLIESKLVDKISFTGSTDVGRRMLEGSAKSNLKRVSLELGGKSPNIIFDDVADLQAAVDRSFEAMFSHKAEKCSEPTRLIVHKKHYQSVLDSLKKKAEAVVCGNPFDAATQQGPQCNKAQYEKVLRYMEIAQSENLRLLAGGKKDTKANGGKGYFIRPTIYADVPPTSRLAKEEIFGPILCVFSFETEDEAVALANDTNYGLAAGFWTADISRAQRVASKLEAGMVYVNRYGCYDFSAPFGGVKQSGWSREMGIHSLESYTKRKTVWIKYS